MPFTVSPSSYIGPQLIMQGASALGQGIASAVEQFNKLKQDEKTSNVVFDQWLSTQDLTPEEKAAKQHEFYSLSPRDKKGAAAGIAEAFANQYKWENLKSLQEQRQALAEERRQRAAALDWTPDEADKQVARWTNNELVPVGPGKWTPVPYGGSDQDQVITDPLSINGQVIPGIGVNRKTGQYVYFPTSTGMQIEIDQRTGVPFYRDVKGNPRPLTGQQIISGEMLQSVTAAKQRPTAQPGVLSRGISSIYNSIFGPKPSPTSTPSPTPQALTAAPSATSTDKVKVKAPNGQIGLVPAAQLEAALAQGYARMPDGGGKQLDQATAMQFLQQAGGDKDKARELARAAGYMF